MSFSRAKVQRFNEIPSCTPSPADYNPIQVKRANSVSSTNEKISDNVSVVSNESLCFRTPSLIRKKKTLSSTTKATPTRLFKANDKEMLQEKVVECNNKDAYIKDLIEQIEELKTQLANLKKEIEELELEKSKYEATLDVVKQRQRVDMDNLVTTHLKSINSLKTTLRQLSLEIANLKDEERVMKEEHKASLEELLKNINEMGEIFNVNVTKVYTEEIKSREDKLIEKQIEIDRINEQLSIVQKKSTEEIEQLNQQHKKEITKIELEMLSIITDKERVLDEQRKFHKLHLSEIENQKNAEIDELKNNYSNQIASLINKKKLDIEQLEEEYRIMREEVECQTRQRIEESTTIWNERLKQQKEELDETLKNYQRESEARIIDIELEKNKLKLQLSNLKEELEELKNETDIEEKYKNLQINYKREIGELQSRCNNLQQQKSTVENELSELKNTSHTYQVTLQKTRETIDALSKRLLDSDHDVERLKQELNICESKKLSLEAECNQYQDKIECLSKTNTELEERQEDVVKTYRKELETVKKRLENKSQMYKNFVDETSKKNENLLRQKQSQLNETKEQLDLQQKLNVEAHDLIEKANKKIIILEEGNVNLREELDKLIIELKEKKDDISTLSIEKQKLMDQLEIKMKNNEKIRQELNTVPKNIEELKNEFEALQEKYVTSQQYSEYYKSKVEEYEKEIDDTKKVQKNYNEQTKKYEELLQKFSNTQADNLKLEKKLEEYESLIGPYREQLEAFEYERKMLLLQKSDAEEEAATMSSKYAQILGHQNQKQKIKHMIDLKEKATELAKANKGLEAKIRSQSKTIEKLKRELAQHKKSAKSASITNKENLNSTGDYSSPLRDRN